MLGTSVDQAACTSLTDSSSGAGAQMYAENRGAGSDDERPPEITMPTGSSDDACVLFFIMMRGERGVPGTVGDTRPKAPAMPRGSSNAMRCSTMT